VTISVFWRNLIAMIRDGYNGQVILHCKDGHVIKIEKREVSKVDDE